MTLLLPALLLAFLVALAWPRFMKWKASTEAERSFAVRFTVFSWLVGFLFLGGFLFLPNKGRILIALPCFLVAVSLAKWWKRSRARLRRSAELQTNFDRARRVN